MIVEPVLAAAPWRTNAELIVDVARMGYLKISDLVIDPTYGKGVFWKKWRPKKLFASDLNPKKSPTGDSVDFRALPWVEGTFDVEVLDGPYKLNGTPSLDDTDERYGTDTVTSWQMRHQMIYDGITEAARVVRTNGLLMVKCQDQVCSGKIRWQTRLFADYAESVGFELIDKFDQLDTGRPQPLRTRFCPHCEDKPHLILCGCQHCTNGRIPSEQHHAYGRPSSLLILRKLRFHGSAAEDACTPGERLITAAWSS